MDRLRRFLPAIPIIPIIAVVLAGAVWFGYRVGEEARRDESSSRPVSRRSSSQGTTVPRLLPDGHVLRCATSLERSRAAADPAGLSPAIDDQTVSDPAEQAVELVDPGPQPQPEVDSESTVDGPVIGEGSTDPTGPPVAAHDQAGPGENGLSGGSSDSLATGAAGSVTRGAVSEAAGATPWATPYRPGERSLQLEQIARQADSHTRRGFDLASRKAYHSARAEFVRALRVVAQGLDSERRSHVHSRALSLGLTAFEEADDFVPVGSGLEGDLDMAGIITGHDTPVLKLTDHRRLTPLQAVQRYVDYARGQLAIAAGGEVAGSMALHALGKLHWSLAEQQAAARPIDDTKALALFQAAAEVCPENYLVFNDLGVLLARAGRYHEAAQVLRRSLAVAENATAWQNLAQVCHRLGDVQRAEEARQRVVALQKAQSKARPGTARPAPSVVWLSPGRFAGSYASVARRWQPAPAAREAAKAGPPSAGLAPVEQASRGWAWDFLLKTRQ